MPPTLGLAVLLDDLLKGEAAALQLRLDDGEAGKLGLAEPVALHLGGNGGRGLVYGGHGALQKQKVSLFHKRDTTSPPHRFGADDR